MSGFSVNGRFKRRAPLAEDVLPAIEQAYRDHYRRFLALSVAMLGDRERGRDAVQEAFARALRSRGDLGGVASLDAWLWQTLVNVCRVEARRPFSPLDEAPEPVLNWQPADVFDVRAVIAALPERQRLVLFLRHYADL